VKIIKVILVTIFIIVMQGFGWAGDLDSMLSKAAEEKKLVMLELGSVGCIPCEQMKPVMSKLSSTYKGKLEVIFVDVRKDTEPARRFRVFGIPLRYFWIVTAKSSIGILVTMPTNLLHPSSRRLAFKYCQAKGKYS